MTTGTQQRGSLAKIKDTTNYYPHQIEGIRDGARRGSFLLADEMGLGKTLQTLTIIAIDFERGWADRAIIVTPASLKWNWQDEIELFTNFTCHVLDGTPKQRSKQLTEFRDNGTDILIVNYEQVIAHKDEINALNFQIAAYDEAHYLKSHKSKRSKAAHGMNSTRKILLTGSPLLNQVNELWSLLYMISPAEFPNYWRFVNRYCVFGGYKDKQIVGVKNSAELQEKVGTVMIRRLKKDVLSLPDKQHIVVRVDLHDKQRELYTQAIEEFRMETSSGDMDIENPLTKFLRLKMVCGTTAAIDPALGDHSHKLDRATEIAEEIVANNEPVVIFTQFRAVQECMIERLANLGIPTWQLHGDIPKETRADVVKAWGASKKPGAIVCMLQVAGVGLNMTAANKAIFLDKLFVPKLNEQAEDRLHRIGAHDTKPVQIFEIVCRKTVEQRIETIIRRKQKLFDTMVETNDWKKQLLQAALDSLEEEETP